MSKIPEWAVKEAAKVGEAIFGRHEFGFVPWPLIAATDQYPADIVARALSEAYTRGQMDMWERAAGKLCDGCKNEAPINDHGQHQRGSFTFPCQAQAIRSLPLQDEEGK